MRTYAAPWGWPLIVISVLSTLVFLAGTVIVSAAPLHGGQYVIAACLLATLFGSLLFTIRGYSLESGRLFIHRLLWRTEISLQGLKEVVADASAMRGSIRSFGNGGLFSISGYFWSKSQGSFRAWVTDMHRTVILRFEGRTLVLSPAEPERFAEDLRKARHLDG
jgi:hypothetical protein